MRKPTANPRESSRIAFSLRSGALLRLMRANRRFACRLKRALPAWASPTQESHPLWKNAGEKPASGFFYCFISLFLIRGGDILFSVTPIRCVQAKGLRAASNGQSPFGLRLRRNRTPSGKVHELKARETSQDPLALGQMLGKNPFANLWFALRFASLTCARVFLSFVVVRFLCSYILLWTSIFRLLPFMERR